MQQKIYTITLLVAVLLFISFSDGPAGGIGNNGVRKQDRSGSPFSHSNGHTCAACHDDGNFTPNLDISLLDGGTPVNSYEAGKTYQLRYALSTSTGSPSAYGVQSVILKNAGNVNAGQFGAAPTGTQIAPIDDRFYFEQSTPSTASVFEVNWTAPDAGSGAITIYAAGVVSNLDNDNDNDNGVANTLELDELISANRTESLAVEVVLFPNPSKNILNLHFNIVEQQSVDMKIMDNSGKVLTQEVILLNQGSTFYHKNVENLVSGIYYLQLTGEKGAVLMKKFVKE